MEQEGSTQQWRTISKAVTSVEAMQEVGGNTEWQYKAVHGMEE